MQFANPVPNHRFDHYCTMNRDKFPFSEELSFSVNPSNPRFARSDHDSQIIMPIIAQGESSQLLSSPTYRPTSHDIICGRGRGSFLHEGNKIYLSLIRRNIDAYKAATKRAEKSTIISTIVSSLKERGFRFLKQDENKAGWYELSNSECYERTAHAIRDLIRKQKGRRNAKKSTSRSSSPTDSDYSVNSEKTEKEPIKKCGEGLKIDMSVIPLLPEQVFTNNAESLPLVVDTSDRPTENDANSFDELICQIPSEVMSPTDTLKTGAFDIFFEITQDDFETILAQLDTDKQTRRDSGSCH